MSRAIINGSTLRTRLPRATTALAVDSLASATGVTISGATTFRISDLEDYTLEVLLRGGAQGGPIDIGLELFNLTLGTVVQSFTKTAKADGSFNLLECVFNFTVTDPAHDYQIRANIAAGGQPNFAVELDAPGFRGVLKDFSAPGGGGDITGSGTIGRYARYTASQVVGDALMGDDGVDVMDFATNLRMGAGTVPPAFAGFATVPGQDYTLRSQDGGAGAVRGGDFIYKQGAGTGGARDSRFSVQDSGSAFNVNIFRTSTIRGTVESDRGDLRFQTLAGDSVEVFQQAATSGTPAPGFLYTGAAHTSLTNTETNDIDVNMARTVEFDGGGGVIADQRAVRFQAPTYSALAAQAITTAATVSIGGAPIAGANMTLTNSFGLDVLGETRLQGTISGVSPARRSRILRSDSLDTDSANFHFVQGEFSNATDPRENQVWRIGYNVDNGGGLVDPAEPAMSIEWETFFEVGATRLVEFHISYVNTSSAISRVFSFSVNRATDFIDVSMRHSKISFFDQTGANQYLVFDPTATTTTISVGGGTSFRKSDNNEAWLSQDNAAASAAIELMRINASDQLQINPSGTAQGILTFVGSGKPYTLQQLNASSGLPGLLHVLGGAHTGVDNNEAIDIDFRLDRTVTFGTGAGLATQRAFLISGPTYAASVAKTITNAATFVIENAPVAGAGPVTITNSFALWVQAGLTQLDGNFATGSGVSMGFYGATPVIQHASTGQTAGFTAGVGTGVNDDSTFTGGTGTAAYTIGDVVRALKQIGLMAAS